MCLIFFFFFRNIYQFALYRITLVCIYFFNELSPETAISFCITFIASLLLTWADINKHVGSAPRLTVQQFPLWISIELLGEYQLVLFTLSVCLKIFSTDASI